MEQKYLTTEDALELARSGDHVWNTWADAHPGWHVDFCEVDFTIPANQFISFKRFRFPGVTDFTFAKFGSGTGFSHTKFNGDVNFDSVGFLESVVFHEADFEGNTDFRNTEFYSYTSFDDARFRGDVSYFETKFHEYVGFRNAAFSKTADFRFTKFKDLAAFYGCQFDREVNFDNASFVGKALFAEVTFRSDTVFVGSRFEAGAYFNDTRIDGEFIFVESMVSGTLDFSSATFQQAAAFDSTQFSSALVLDGTAFASIPDFRSTKMNFHVSMDSLEVFYRGETFWRWWKQGGKLDDAPKYRRLKEMAILAQDHRQEQNFFAMEQKAMRGTRYKGLAVIPSLLYETFSDFGRSITRPAIGLTSVWMLSALTYLLASLGARETLNNLACSVSSALLYSATQILPFVSGSSEVKKRAVDALFFGDVPDWLGWVNLGEGLLAFIFLFLIGLALRNRFRI